MNTIKRINVLVALLAISLFCTAGAIAKSTDDMLTMYISAANANMPPNLNAEALANLFAIDGVQGHQIGLPPNTNNPMRGREEMKEFYSSFNRIFADWTHIESKRTVQGRQAVWEGTAKGTHKETGKLVKIPIAFSIEFDNDGFVAAMDVYVNSSLMVEQLK